MVLLPHFPSFNIQDAAGGFAWDRDTYGNQRAVVHVKAPADAVWAHIPWRRRDLDPDKKNLIVVDAKTGERVKNVARMDINREFGDIVFQPRGAGEYHVYYLPFVKEGSYYPKVTYPAPEETADTTWLTAHQSGWQRLPKAAFVRFEAVAPNHAFTEMERIATREETASVLAKHPAAGFLVFPEDRSRPIRMTRDLPACWVSAKPGFRGAAERDEFYAFQLGVFAARRRLASVRVEFPELRDVGNGKSVLRQAQDDCSRHPIPDTRDPIPAAAFRCINLGGLTYTGQPLRKTVSVDRGRVQAIWCGVQVPRDAKPGAYEGTIRVTSGRETVSVPFRLDVSKTIAANHGDDDPARLSRLRWLDSRLADDDSVVPPFTPVRVAGRELSVLGRRVWLGADGLPESIASFFTPEVTSVGDQPMDVLARPIHLTIEGKRLEGKAFRVTRRGVGSVSWSRKARAGNLSVDLRGKLDFDGTLEYQVAVHADEAASVRDIRLEIPFRQEAATYMMGLGQRGGTRPASFEWRWDVQKNQDAVWLGAVNAGLQVTLKDDQYVRPLNTNFYHHKPLVMPTSWCNGGKGRVTITEEGGDVLLRCTSGPRRMRKGEVIRFDFRLAMTPFKPLDTEGQFARRFFHAFRPVSDVAALGANTINVHHASDINPYINYPFLRPKQMKAYVDEAHASGMLVKIYYTVRELTTRAPELWALLSLGDEVFSQGKGGGYSWLQEHVADDYIAAWFDPAWEDTSLIMNGISRWHNFYVVGLDWLVKHIGIDGLYLDDVAFDREVMKRIRRVLEKRRISGFGVRVSGADAIHPEPARAPEDPEAGISETRNPTPDTPYPGPYIDLHSANQFNPNDGFASSANLYMELFPYLDRLWFGEYFDYDSAPDYWLVEVSGIPFGLMGEMLEKGGNPWRGMVFGMTNRLGWASQPDPRPVWRVLDAFGMSGAQMAGWWSPSSPVRTDNPSVLATVYLQLSPSGHPHASPPPLKRGREAPASSDAPGVTYASSLSRGVPDVPGSINASSLSRGVPNASGPAPSGNPPPADGTVKPSRALIALASWAPTRVSVRLSFDWSALGLEPARCRLTAIESEGFQPAATFRPDEPIPIEPGKGWLLMLQPDQ